jgi:hypothetical protein
MGNWPILQRPHVRKFGGRRHPAVHKVAAHMAVSKLGHPFMVRAHMAAGARRKKRGGLLAPAGGRRRGGALAHMQNFPILQRPHVRKFGGMRARHAVAAHTAISRLGHPYLVKAHMSAGRRKQGTGFLADLAKGLPFVGPALSGLAEQAGYGRRRRGGARRLRRGKGFLADLAKGMPFVGPAISGLASQMGYGRRKRRGRGMDPLRRLPTRAELGSMGGYLPAIWPPIGKGRKAIGHSIKPRRHGGLLMPAGGLLMPAGGRAAHMVRSHVAHSVLGTPFRVRAHMAAGRRPHMVKSHVRVSGSGRVTRVRRHVKGGFGGARARDAHGRFM